MSCITCTTPGMPVTQNNDLATLAPQAVALAAKLLKKGSAGLTADERRQAEMMARLMDDPAGKAFTLALTDQVFRSGDAVRSAAEFRHVLTEHGMPRYLSWGQRLAMRMAHWASHLCPGLVIRAITEQIRGESGRVILPGEDNELMPYLESRRRAGFRMNLNQLGEAILGEDEAERRLQAVLGRLRTPGIDYISVKISSICSRINVLAWDATVEAIKARLRQLYRTTMDHRGGAPQSSFAATATTAKFVNLDMEEYRDLELTLAAFQQTLDEPEFRQLGAGIVLQAYLPDSHDAQRRLTQWALKRVADGGAPVKLRLVKGANLAMERVEAELHGWEQAPYPSKADVDASFKRMLEFAVRPEHTRAVRVGVASHNLFDLAMAMLLAEKRGVTEAVDLEMLEGMANHQARVIREARGDLLLYAPVVKREDFHSAMAYLVRRLDENTARENFLHDLFGLEEGTEAWNRQSEAFLKSCGRAATIQASPRRSQDRTRSPLTSPGGTSQGFRNEPNTDWVLAHNRNWIDAIRNRWARQEKRKTPLQIGGEFIGRDYAGMGRDPSRPGVPAYCFETAGPEDVDRALDTAVKAIRDWTAMGENGRARILRTAADHMSDERGETIACMILDGGKSIPEADAEVSEGIDFARYYAGSAEQWATVSGVRARPLGVVVVAPPWNFPYAIPAGGVLAALAMGNAVILKPARESVLVAWQLASQLWEAGVPREVLQFVVCRDHDTGRSLIVDPRVAAVILTGAWETAQRFLGWKPELYLCAETSGKNAMVITAAADRDLAIKDLVQSAFGHSGQKCSAASLAILEAEVYDDPRFLSQLRDAAGSLVTGSAWDPASQVTPVIREPSPELLRGLTQLDDGESWLLEPRRVGDNPNCWSPGIRLGVKPGSWYHRTECFGPVLGLMRAKDFEHALEIQNSHELGLTAGLHTLDSREMEVWRERVEAGNCYINRPITGAIVQRQPFGGWKKSSVGPGAKAGGPNYVAQFARWEETESGDRPEAARISYARAWAEHFSVEHDPTRLACESNVFRYRPLREVFLRLDAKTAPADLELAILAARTAGTAVCVSISAASPQLESAANAAGCPCVIQNATAAADELSRRRPEMLRTTGPAEEVVLRAANKLGIRRIHAPMSASGRLELTRWMKEQAISRTMHRYGWTKEK